MTEQPYEVDLDLGDDPQASEVAQRERVLDPDHNILSYDFVDEELTTAVDALLEDEVLRSSLDALGGRIRDAEGRRRAADLLEDLGRTRASDRKT